MGRCCSPGGRGASPDAALGGDFLRPATTLHALSRGGLSAISTSSSPSEPASEDRADLAGGEVGEEGSEQGGGGESPRAESAFLSAIRAAGCEAFRLPGGLSATLAAAAGAIAG